MNIDVLNDILLSENPSIKIRENEEDVFELLPELKVCKGFNQNNPWHVYDVYDHILKVLDGVPSILSLRYAALFHDIGKPLTYTEDEDGIGHFYGHFNESKKIFLKFAHRNNLDQKLTLRIEKLIYFHDYSLSKLSDHKLKKVLSNFDKEELKELFKLKKADLLGQNPDKHHMLKEYEEEEKRLTEL